MGEYADYWHGDNPDPTTPERRVVHIFGFYDDDGTPRLPNDATVQDGTVYAATKGIEANVVRHGGTLANLRTTRRLDGWLVATEFDTPAQGNAARMWHRVVIAKEPWA